MLKVWLSSTSMHDIINLISQCQRITPSGRKVGEKWEKSGRKVGEKWEKTLTHLNT